MGDIEKSLGRKGDVDVYYAILFSSSFLRGTLSEYLETEMEHLIKYFSLVGRYSSQVILCISIIRVSNLTLSQHTQCQSN